MHIDRSFERILTLHVKPFWHHKGHDQAVAGAVCCLCWEDPAELVREKWEEITTSSAGNTQILNTRPPAMMGKYNQGKQGHRSCDPSA